MKHPTVRLWWLSAVCVMGVEAAAQPSATAASCGNCRIVSTTVAILGATDGPGAFTSFNLWAARDRLERFIVWGEGVGEGAIVQLYDSRGRFVRSIGRKGSGPGEYRMITAVLPLPGDSLAISDAALQRVTVLTPGFAVARTVPLALNGLINPVLLGGSPTMILGNDADAGANPPIAIIDLASGRSIRHFGSLQPGTPPAIEGARRVVAVLGDRVWVGRASRYEIEEWRIDGTRRSPIARSGQWFVPKPASSSREMPSPVLDALAVEDSVLWVSGSVADARWEQTMVPVPGVNTRTTNNPLLYRDGIVDALDPGTGRVLASTRLDLVLRQNLGGGLWIGTRPDSDDRPVIEVVRLRLIPPGFEP